MCEQQNVYNWIWLCPTCGRFFYRTKDAFFLFSDAGCGTPKGPSREQVDLPYTPPLTKALKK